MGLLGGSVSYTRFYVRGDAPSGNFRSRFEKAVAHDAFRPLAALGRWSLSFYMLHQPVLIGLLMLWMQWQRQA
mgnify:CR=1 FL=1